MPLNANILRQAVLDVLGEISVPIDISLITERVKDKLNIRVLGLGEVNRILFDARDEEMVGMDGFLEVEKSSSSSIPNKSNVASVTDAVQETADEPTPVNDNYE